MADTGREALEWSIVEDVPEGRCGFTVEYSDYLRFVGFPGNVTCWRESWREHERCIWHADVEGKPSDELAAARTDIWERLDGAVLRETDLEDVVSFTGCTLLGTESVDASLWGADLTDADLQRADLTNADLAGADLTAASLRYADFTDASFRRVTLADFILGEPTPPDASLRGATLTDASLWGADLTDADLSGATLTDAFFGRAALTGTGITYSELDKIEIDEGTTFGGRSRWEAVADRNAENAIPYLPWRVPPFRALGRPSTNPDGLEQAELQYRATQRILRENDLQQLPELAVREKHARRKRALAERDYWIWFKLAFYRWPLGYGEQVRNVLATSALTIVGFALVYPFVGGMEATEGETTPYAFGNALSLPFEVPWWLEVFGANLYFSAVTFSTLGYGDIQPATPAAQFLASVESLLGALLMAFLVFVLGRRTTW